MKKKTKTIQAKQPKLKLKDVTGRVKLLKVIPYKGCMVYLRRIGIDYFEFLIVFNRQIHTAYYVLTLDDSKKDLTSSQVAQAGALAMAGACTTIDVLLEEAIDKSSNGLVNPFEKGRPEVLN